MRVTREMIDAAWRGEYERGRTDWRPHVPTPEAVIRAILEAAMKVLEPPAEPAPEPGPTNAMAMLSNFGPGVLANLGPPPVLEPTVSPIGSGGLSWAGKPKWNCSSSSVGSTSLGLARSRAWPRSLVFIGASCGGRLAARCRRCSITHSEPSRSWGRWRSLSTRCLTRTVARHTARRIHRRILREFPDTAVAESTVRTHVRERKRQMGLERRETFVPLRSASARTTGIDPSSPLVRPLGDPGTGHSECGGGRLLRAHRRRSPAAEDHPGSSHLFR
jgi:hypothetical protein